MRSIIRHLSPFIRSRRRIPFFFITILLLTIAALLYLINHRDQQTQLPPIEINRRISSNNLTTNAVKSLNSNK